MSNSAKKLTAPLLALAIAVVVALAAYNFIKSLKFKSTDVGTSVIGQLESVSGQVEHRLPNTVEILPAKNGTPLHNQEMIITQRGSVAVLTLAVGTTLRVNESSRIVAEIDATRPDAVIATVLEGSVTVEKPGKPGAFRLFREGREIDLSTSGSPKSPVISADPKAGAPEAETLPGLVISATTPDEAAPTPEPRPKEGLAQNTGATDVLTNEDIVRQLRGQSGFFQRCYLTFIHRIQQQAGSAPTDAQGVGPTGTVVVGFTIQTNGRATGTSVLRSDFKDAVLHKCLTEVIERTNFKAFSGGAVPVLEFPITLQ